MGVIDRLMRASVDRAQRMQPKRVERAVDEALYAAPMNKDLVAGVSIAAARLVSAGLTPALLGSVAVRGERHKATTTRPEADLRSIDNRSLERADLDDRVTPALAGLRAGNQAAVWAYPTALLAADAGGLEIEPVSAGLALVAGPINVVDDIEQAGSGVSIVRGDGVLAGDQTPEAAVTRLEAAEALARMTIAKHSLGRIEHG